MVGQAQPGSRARAASEISPTEYTFGVQSALAEMAMATSVSVRDYGTTMSDDTGGKVMSAVPVGTAGKSAVIGADTGEAPPTARVVATTAGAWMTPIVAGGVEPGDRSSFERENPYATNAPATTTPSDTAIRTIRDRLFDSVVSSTTTTLPR